MSGDFSKDISLSSSQQDRILQLKKEFLDITKQNKPGYTLEELKEYLSLKSGRAFDPNLLKEIFDSVNIATSATISTENFISGYYLTETSIKSQLDVLKKLIKDQSLKFTNSKRQYIEAKANKIPEDNNSITIIIKKTDVKSSKELIVRVIVDDWEVTTNPTNGFNSKWDESFNFNVLSHRNIIIELYESDKNKISNCLGTAEISLNTLRDEEVHEDWVVLQNNSIQIGKILVSAHWINIKVDYLERILNNLEKSLVDKRKELSALEKKYEDFLYPFKVTSPQWFTSNTKFKKAELELSRQLDEFTTKTFGGSVRWPIALKLSIYLYLALSTATMLFRPDFFNVNTNQIALAITGYYWYLVLPLQEINYKLLAMSVLISQAYDFIWLYLYATV
jgi:C2 domain